MMNGTVFNIQRFSLHDGPGVRTTVFMKGCSLHCRWCHNPEGLSPEISLQYNDRSCLMCGKCAEVCTHEVHTLSNGTHTVNYQRCVQCGACIVACPARALQYSGRQYTPQELTQECLRDRAYYKKRGGVTFSGGEPLLQSEFVAETARLCKEEGIPTIYIDSAGNVPWESFENVLPYTDAFLYDMKAFSEDLHRENTGCSNRLIMDNLIKLGKTQKGIFIRIPVIPSVNDSPREIQQILDFLHNINNIHEVRLLPFHAVGREKYTTLGMKQPEDYGAVSSDTLNILQQLVTDYMGRNNNGCKTDSKND